MIEIGEPEINIEQVKTRIRQAVARREAEGRNVMSKTDILARLRYSPEGKRKNITVGGLRLRSQRLAEALVQFTEPQSSFWPGEILPLHPQTNSPVLAPCPAQGCSRQEFGAL